MRMLRPSTEIDSPILIKLSPFPSPAKKKRRVSNENGQVQVGEKMINGIMKSTTCMPLAETIVHAEIGKSAACQRPSWGK